MILFSLFSIWINPHIHMQLKRFHRIISAWFDIKLQKQLYKEQCLWQSFSHEDAGDLVLFRTHLKWLTAFGKGCLRYNPKSHLNKRCAETALDNHVIIFSKPPSARNFMKCGRERNPGKAKSILFSKGSTGSVKFFVVIPSAHCLHGLWSEIN